MIAPNRNIDLPDILNPGCLYLEQEKDLVEIIEYAVDFTRIILSIYNRFTVSRHREVERR
jgi:hypothetical protein